MAVEAVEAVLVDDELADENDYQRPGPPPLQPARNVVAKVHRSFYLMVDCISFINLERAAPRPDDPTPTKRARFTTPLSPAPYFEPSTSLFLPPFSFLLPRFRLRTLGCFCSRSIVDSFPCFLGPPSAPLYVYEVVHYRLVMPHPLTGFSSPP